VEAIFAPARSTSSSAQLKGCPFRVGAAQFEYWAPYRIVVDVTTEDGDSFSLEAAKAGAS